MKKFISILVIFVFAVAYLYPAQAHGSPWAIWLEYDEQGEAISPMKAGQKAPFDGVLYSTAAAAKVQVQLENAAEQCSIEKAHEVDKQKAKQELALANEKAGKEAAQNRLTEVLEIKNDQIQFLTKDIERREKKGKRNWGPLYLVGGVVGGILLMAVSAYAYREINN